MSNKLKNWRLKEGLTLKEMAIRIGLGGSNPARTYQRFESGVRLPDVVTIERILEVTDGAVTVDDLHKACVAYHCSKNQDSVQHNGRLAKTAMPCHGEQA